MQISSSNSTLYSDVYSQQQNSANSKDDSLEPLKQDLQNTNQYRTTSITMQEKNSRLEQGDKLLEISETKKTVEKHKIDVYA